MGKQDDDRKPVAWDAVVLTCSSKEWTQSLQQELDIYYAKGYLGKDLIHLVVEDPKSNVGSGGATLNALLTVVEYMSARRGFTTINADVLLGARILIMHTGRSYTYEACSRPFVALPAVRDAPEYDGLVFNFDLIFSIITKKIAVFAKPGIWVCSTDIVVSVPDKLDLEMAFGLCDVCVVSIPMPPKMLKDHGVYKLDAKGYVENIIYQAELPVLESCAREDGTVPAAIGMVFLSHPVAQKLLSFYTKPPLDACTYMGLDSGQPPLMDIAVNTSIFQLYVDFIGKITLISTPRLRAAGPPALMCHWRGENRLRSLPPGQAELSLFFDVLLPMTSSVSEEDFVRGKRSGPYGKPFTEHSGNLRFNMEYARQMLWSELHGFCVRACVIEGGKYSYLTHSATEHKKLLLNFPQTSGLGYSWTNRAHVEIEKTCKVSEDSTVINSLLSGDVVVSGRTVVSHCDLGGSINVGKDSFFSGLHVEPSKSRSKGIDFPDSMVVQGFNIHLKTLGMTRYMVTVHGRYDDIQAASWKSMSTFCNQPWLLMLSRTGIGKEELWNSDVENDQQTIQTAKLFPFFHISENVGLKEILWLMGAIEDDKEKSILKRWRSSWRVSLTDILANIDMGAEFEYKRKLFFKVGEVQLQGALTARGHKGFCSFFNSASVEDHAGSVLQTLDRVASETSSPGIAARTLANIADVLGGMAGTKGGLRSGPAGNVAWRKAFSYLEAGNFPQGVAAMAKEREKWMNRPDLLIRAARHYEGAAQILVRQAVMTAKQFFSSGEGTLPLMNKWVQADCPARIDLSGGWSDTPPITYEHGGAVIMVGLLINEKRPIGARARRINEGILRLTMINEGTAKTEVECRVLGDLEDYCQPHAPGSLLKAAFVCVDLIDLHSATPLHQQLLDNFGCGFEVQSWSNLPHGSGMGTSSILAGAVLAAVLTAAGKSFDTTGLIHAVLYLEQLLTSGGGWQDQVGGLTGGVKLGLSEAKLPLKVDVVDLNISKDYIEKFNSRLVLIYTGKTRLARNLLQDVIRNWYARNPYIVSTEDSLVRLAQECSHAFMDGAFETVGSCVSRYWEMKKLLAPGCESVTIARIMTVLRPYMYGMCSAGAGGGGFIYGIMREPNCHAFVREILEQQEDLEAVVYDAVVDDSGLTITIEE